MRDSPAANVATVMVGTGLKNMVVEGANYLGGWSRQRECLGKGSSMAQEKGQTTIMELETGDQSTLAGGQNGCASAVARLQLIAGCEVDTMIVVR